ncbi:D-alanyl-D-alanine carboxypeptidase [Bacillus oleivorans]|uniref:D-alanyl-D-alanine carboxypeptidase n=1 Tax=Bacillus oleivorans TaxID=1448271 RepID=A0A285CWN0_9BACI|nr:M15 family metallopeptidase [Bacillus oleivorans]SNX71478.1 D-alanyl-D-alanine carboxypeptidase [Bacillus oleivorans]
MKNKWTIPYICFILSGCGISGQEASEKTPADQVIEPPAENTEVIEEPGLPLEQNQDEENQPPAEENTDKNSANQDTNEEGNPQDEEEASDKPETVTPPAEPEKNNPESENQEPSIPTVANPTAITVMVNKSFKLPDSYRPADLARPSVAFVFGNQQLEKALLREEAARALENMFAQAKKEEITLLAASGFRSFETQTVLFENEVKQVGYEKASMAVAYPGTSEHQTGLAMDITAASVNYILTEEFGEKPEGKWLANNAHKFGFILRYPLGKESITGYQYEPWHFRYVGTEMATEIFENKLTLEEYVGQKQGV